MSDSVDSSVSNPCSDNAEAWILAPKWSNGFATWWILGRPEPVDPISAMSEPVNVE